MRSPRQTPYVASGRILGLAWQTGLVKRRVLDRPEESPCDPRCLVLNKGSM